MSFYITQKVQYSRKNNYNLEEGKGIKMDVISFLCISCVLQNLKVQLITDDRLLCILRFLKCAQNIVVEKYPQNCNELPLMLKRKTQTHTHKTKPPKKPQQKTALQTTTTTHQNITPLIFAPFCHSQMTYVIFILSRAINFSISVRVFTKILYFSPNLSCYYKF